MCSRLVDMLIYFCIGSRERVYRMFYGSPVFGVTDYNKGMAVLVKMM